ncbi:hypothetical protein [Massilia sp. CCM 8734]|uniref:hypothetical protein n=1 Tax=Massilia sp. CCM 8734 TaxID=2609283 RepID=UPI00141E29D9|nr:hypothetical protein [Massilia sp. CCM 8734]NHZ94528.1 hypothetical protein [Massilia sp. CCM 8734]
MRNSPPGGGVRNDTMLPTPGAPRRLPIPASPILQPHEPGADADLRRRRGLGRKDDAVRWPL